MEKAKLEELKDKVPCAAVLEHVGFALDLKESTRKAMKYRREASIIIVIHEGKGWFDPLSDQGRCLRPARASQGRAFVETMNQVADLVRFVATEPVWQRSFREREPDMSIADRWQARRKLWRGSAGCYLPARRSSSSRHSARRNRRRSPARAAAWQHLGRA
ncbi:hypothetical protein [Mesorhizobium sp. WSM3626]|uniref:hypothetical protein n=1 Tax=Mesorhizobium sp. WSM3626 TaxID=1040987 RepID=UPI0004B8C9FD